MARILGISCYYHDSAAACLEDGVIVAAAEEERFTRRKHDTAFPFHAINFCLGRAGAVLDEVDAVAFYEKPLARFQDPADPRRHFPLSLPAFMKTIPDWLGRRLLVPDLVRRHLGYAGPLLFVDHHLPTPAAPPFSHRSRGGLPHRGRHRRVDHGQHRPRSETAVLEPLAEVRYPHSLGMLYRRSPPGWGSR